MTTTSFDLNEAFATDDVNIQEDVWFQYDPDSMVLLCECNGRRYAAYAPYEDGNYHVQHDPKQTKDAGVISALLASGLRPSIYDSVKNEWRMK